MLNFVPSKRSTAAQSLQHPWLRGELPKVTEPSRGGKREEGREGVGDHVGRSSSRTDRSWSAKRSRSPSR